MVDYTRAASIGRSSLSSLILQNRNAGAGIGSSIGGAVSSKLKAKATTIASKFDYLNLVHKLTGGNRLATTLVGLATGRKASNIAYFTGDKLNAPKSETATAVSGGSSEAEVVLKDMLKFMRRVRKDELKRRKKEQLFAEEKFNEEQARHAKLLEAIQNFVNVTVASREDVDSESSDDKSSFFDGFKSLFGGLIGKLGGFIKSFSGLMSGVVGGMLSLLGGIRKMFTIGAIFKGIGSLVKSIGILFESLSWVKNLKWLVGINSVATLAKSVFTAALSVPGLVAMVVGSVAYLSYRDEQGRKKLKEYDDRIELHTTTGVSLKDALSEFEWKEYQNLSSMYRPEKDTVTPEYVTTTPGEAPMKFDPQGIELQTLTQEIQNVRVYEANKAKAEQTALKVNVNKERLKAEQTAPKVNRWIPESSRQAIINSRLKSIQEENDRLNEEPSWTDSGTVPPIITNKVNNSSTDVGTPTSARRKDRTPTTDAVFSKYGVVW